MTLKGLAYATHQKINAGVASSPGVGAIASPDPRQEDAKARQQMREIAASNPIAAAFIVSGAFISATIGKLFGFEQDPRRAAAGGAATSILVHVVGAAGANNVTSGRSQKGSSDASKAPQIPPVTGRAAQRGVPRGFSSEKEFLQFGSSLRKGLSDAGYGDVEAGFQGSSVTGYSYEKTEPFDKARTSDFDIALGGGELLARAKSLGIPLRSEGTRTGPLMPRDIQKLGFQDLQAELSKRAGRPVEFMIYGSIGAAIERGSTIIIK